MSIEHNKGYLKAHRANKTVGLEEKTGSRLPGAAALGVGFLAITSEATAENCYKTKGGEYSSYTSTVCTSC